VGAAIEIIRVFIGHLYVIFSLKNFLWFIFEEEKFFLNQKYSSKKISIFNIFFKLWI